jgi:hypothetical protein
LNYEGKVFVYVQAIPESVPSRVKNFVDLSEATTTFRMNHSSKVALERAKNSSLGVVVVALGHTSILREAIARGADDVIALPLCDDPLIQAQRIKEQVLGNLQSSVFFVGENIDGPFSGSSLCGALSVLLDLNLEIDLENGQSQLAKRGFVVLLKDGGTKAYNVDIRRLGAANTRQLPQSQVIGTSSLERKDFTKNPETITNPPAKEIASTISRRLRRFTV